MQHAEDLLRADGIIGEDDSLYDSQHIAVVHHLNAGLRAQRSIQRDVDYIVRDGEVIIVDEFTGRTMPGRRWSDGLHQAVEAKEGVPIQRENQTLASITFQNYFRMYEKLAGMTGTADTEAFEFQSDLRPRSRGDSDPPADGAQGRRRPGLPDAEDAKYDAIVEDIKDCTSAASRCWSVPPRSRRPNCSSEHAARSAACRTRC